MSRGIGRMFGDEPCPVSGDDRMSHTPHELHEEFPELAARIHDLKVSNAHFRKLFDEYHEINRAVHRAEAKIEPMEDLAQDALRKQRLHLKDQLHAMLTA
jgi:uncharacterized protein YdcH (DUF465 family)